MYQCFDFIEKKQEKNMEMQLLEAEKQDLEPPAGIRGKGATGNSRQALVLSVGWG